MEPWDSRAGGSIFIWAMAFVLYLYRFIYPEAFVLYLYIL